MAILDIQNYLKPKHQTLNQFNTYYPITVNDQIIFLFHKSFFTIYEIKYVLIDLIIIIKNKLHGRLLFDLLWFIYQNVSNSYELCNISQRYEILYTLNLGCSFITLREPCNNQRPRCFKQWHTYSLFTYFFLTFQPLIGLILGEVQFMQQ